MYSIKLPVYHFRGVIISDYKLGKEAMNEIAFAGRPKPMLRSDVVQSVDGAANGNSIMILAVKCNFS